MESDCGFSFDLTQIKAPKFREQFQDSEKRLMWCKNGNNNYSAQIVNNSQSS